LPVRFAPSRSLAALGLASSLLLLAACGEDEATTEPTPAASASATPSASAPASKAPVKVSAAKNLDAIKVAGNYGKSPKVTVKAPWAIDKTRTEVLEPSDGAVVKAGQTVEVNYFGVNGRTGKKFDDSFSRGQSIAFDLDQVVPGFQKGLVGQRQGSRVLVAMPGTDGYDTAGGSQQAGIQVGDSLIFVVDLVGAQLAGPQGSRVLPKAGLPTVTDRAGTPSITVPKTPAPSKLQVQPLIKGKGTIVAEGDTVTFNYLWVAYRDGRRLETTYGAEPASSPLAGLLPGMVKGLTGQPVGSRVLLVIPPAQGYPNGNAQPKIDKGETLVMVVDILFTQAGQ
jgi:peptidylprolyl isomerase